MSNREKQELLAGYERIKHYTPVQVSSSLNSRFATIEYAIKEYQAKTALDLGAREIDMVMNIPALKNGEKAIFIADISGVVKAANGTIVKVILENCYLTQEEKRRA